MRNQHAYSNNGMEHIGTIIDSSIKAIPTYYKGVKFRSRLEASYAKTLDSLNIRWAYEPEGYQINDLLYLPDFFLSEIKTILEIKGPTVPGLEKTKALAGHFQDDEKWWNPEILVIYGDANGIIKNALDNDAVHMGLCGNCNTLWFYPIGGYYGCRSCGFYDGDHHILDSEDHLDLVQTSITQRR